MADNTHHLARKAQLIYEEEMAAVAFKKQNHDYKIKLWLQTSPCNRFINLLIRHWYI